MFPSQLVCREVTDMPRFPKLTRKYHAKEMVEMVRENWSLYDHMDLILLDLPQCPITCSHVPSTFSETSLYSTHRPIICTALVLEVYTLTCQLCTLGQGCGSFSGCLYGCMETPVAYGFTDIDADIYVRKET